MYMCSCVYTPVCLSLFIQIAMLLDPNSTIIKTHGKYAGPLAETEVRAYSENL